MQKKKKKAARQDVADAAGVSKAVVTWVMNGTAKTEHYISDATIKRVRAAAKRLGYSPSIWGKLINSQKSGIIALVSSDLTDPAVGEFVRELNAATIKRGYKLALIDLAGKDTFSKSVLKDFEDGLAEGFILDVLGGKLLDRFKAKAKRGEAICVRGRDMSGTALASVEIDNFDGCMQVLEHLCTPSTESVGIISDSPEFAYTEERLDAIKQFMTEVPDCQFQFYYRKNTEDQFESGSSAVKEWLSRSKLPQAIFALGDAIALGAMSEMTEAGITIPGDVRIAGFDGTIYSRYASPPLTTVAQPFKQMAEAALDICLDLANTGTTSLKNLRFRPELLIRKSSM